MEHAKGERCSEGQSEHESAKLKINPKSNFFFQSPTKNNMEDTKNSLDDANNEQFQEESILNENSEHEISLNNTSYTTGSEKESSDSSSSRSASPVEEEPLDIPKPSYGISASEPESKVVDPRPKSQPEEFVIYKSMNYLPFTTRFEMLRKGTNLRVVDNNPRQAVKIVDNKPPEYSSKTCRMLKYIPVSSESSSSTSEHSSPESSQTIDVVDPDINNNSDSKNNCLNYLNVVYNGNIETTNKDNNNCCSIQETADINNNNDVAVNNNNIQHKSNISPHNINNIPHDLNPDKKNQKYTRYTISRKNENFDIRKRKASSPGPEHEQCVYDRQLETKVKCKESDKQPESELEHNNSIIKDTMQEEMVVIENNLKNSSDSEFRASEAAEILLSMANSSAGDSSTFSPVKTNTSVQSSQPCPVPVSTQPSINYSIASSSDMQSIIRHVLPHNNVNISKVIVASKQTVLPKYFLKPSTGYVLNTDLNQANKKPRIHIVKPTKMSENGSSSGIHTVKYTKLNEGSSSSGIQTTSQVMKLPPSSTYITVIKKGKIEQVMVDKNQQLKVKNISLPHTSHLSQPLQNPSESKQEPDFDSFACSYHGLCVDLSGNTIHKCLMCSKVYTVYDAYINHVRVHYKQQNKCTVCGKTFSRSWLLKGHMRTHTGERPYVCDHPDCNRAFADRSNLRSHMMIHKTKDKQHLCPNCDRAFAQKRYLHKHMSEVCRGSGYESNGSTASTSSQSTQCSQQKYRKVLPKQSVYDSPCSTASICSTDSQLSQ